MKIAGKIFLGILIVFVFALLGMYVFVQLKKPQLLASVTQSLQNQINGEVHIDDIGFTVFHDFPKATLKLKGFYLRGPEYPIYKKDFLKVETLLITINPFSLFAKHINFKELSLINAEAFIFKTKAGLSNLEVFKKRPADTSTTVEASEPFILSLENLEIKNTKLVFLDSLKQKYFGLILTETHNKILHTDSCYHINLKGAVDFLGLTFNAQKGTFLKNKSTQLNLHLNFYAQHKKLEIEPSEIGLQTGKLKLEGAFIFTKPLSYQLSIQTDSILIDEGLSVLADTVQHKLKKIGAYGYAAAKVSINGIAEPGNPPFIRVAFSTKNAAAKLFGKQQLDNLNVEGVYVNYLAGTTFKGKEFSSVTISDLHTLSDGIPVKGKLSLQNLADPDLEVDVNIGGDLLGLNSQLDQNKFQVISGIIEGKVYYKGKLQEYENERLLKLRGALEGYVKIKNGSIYMVKKDLTIHGVETYISFDREKVNIHQITAAVDKDKLNLKGTMIGYIPFFTQPDPKSKLSLKLETDHLDLAHFFKKTKKKTKHNKPKHKSKALGIIANLEEKMEIGLHIKAKQLVKEGFVANNLLADIELKNNSIRLQKISMQFAGGAYLLKGKMDKVGDDNSPIQISASMKDVNIKEVMKAFNNFGLAHLTHNNISGIFSTQIALNGVMDAKGGFMNKHLRGNVNFTVKQGRLLDFEPIMTIGAKVYKKKNLSNVEFAEIQGHVTTLGSESDLEKMEVSSNLIRMFVQGHHSTTGLSTFVVQVPLKFLTEKHEGVKPENIGNDAKTGPNVYLKLEAAKGEKLKVSYMPFPKKR